MPAIWQKKGIAMFTKNQTVTLTIDDISSDGNGVGKVDGFAVFVPFTAKGDTIRCRIVKVNRTFAFGIVEELLSPSPDRIATDCPVFTKCGGCAFRHLRYEAECEAKQKWVQDCLQRIGGFSIEVLPIVPSVRQDGYRNKAQYPVCKNPDGTLAIGFYAKRSHRVISCADCKLQPPIFREIVEAIQIFVTRNGISIYDEESHSGLLRHIFLRIAEATGQIMVCLVINGKDFPHKSQLVDCLRALSSQIVSIVLNFNLKQTNVILGPKCLTIYGSDLIADQLCDMTFQLSPLSFYQVNRTSTEKLYAIAREFAALTGDETVLDLYCGTGTIGLSAAAHLKRLIGVEIVPEAVENAQANAAANGIEHAEFYCADASQAVVRLAEQGVSPDVIFVDPPRKGCDPEVLEAISQLSPSRVVMVSCNPATLGSGLPCPRR